MLRCISATAAVSRELAPPAASADFASVGNAPSPPPLGEPEVGVVVEMPRHAWFGGPSDIRTQSGGSLSPVVVASLAVKPTTLKCLTALTRLCYL